MLCRCKGKWFMCGIVGYVGKKQVVPLILRGLERLEYRGYDSAGIAVAGNGQGLQIRRAPGKLRNLETVIQLQPLDGTYGIGHTRWATHGCPTEANAHPHRDCTGRIAVVHNGIIENYVALKRALRAQRHIFSTETDTEVIAHVVEECFAGARNNGAVKQLTGVFALAVMAVDEPDKIVAARDGPPVVIGLGEDEYFVASDVPAVLYHTRNLFFLDDGDLAVMTPSGVTITDFDGHAIINRPVQQVTWDPIMAEKGGFKHFMLKEIYEQPRAIRDTTLGRVALDTGKVFLDEMEISDAEFQELRKINIAACGTSWHAGLAGKFMIERLSRMPVDIDYASKFRYRDPLLGPDSLMLLIAQSGETADTIAAQREAKAKGSKTVGICNVVGSMVTREAHGTVNTHAGPEIGVASTKAFTAQLTALFLFALYVAEKRGQISKEQSLHYILELSRIPGKLELVLAREEECEGLAKEYSWAKDFLFLGRGIHYPIALEGALKLKEISYIHAEGYPAGEMKHGPNALIDENLPVVILATCDKTDPASVVRYEKTLSALTRSFFELRSCWSTLMALGSIARSRERYFCIISTTSSCDRTRLTVSRSIPSSLAISRFDCPLTCPAIIRLRTGSGV